MGGKDISVEDFIPMTTREREESDAAKQQEAIQRLKDHMIKLANASAAEKSN